MILTIPILIIIIDQVSKLLAIKYLKGAAPNIIIENIFQLTYVENYGAAFGILQNRKIFFVLITLLVCVGVGGFLLKYNKNISGFLKLALSMYLGGSIGNLIDRIRLGYVVDFLSVKLFNSYNFPVFNMADVFIVIGTIMIVIVLLFDKDAVKNE